MTTWVMQDLNKSEVVDIVSLAEYCQQTIGTPFPTKGDLVVARKRAQDLLRLHPALTWQSFAKVADFARARKKRPARLSTLLEGFRDAWSQGFLPELDPKEPQDPQLERLIGAALQVESDEYWRERLTMSRGIDGRRRSFEEWLATSSISA